MSDELRESSQEAIGIREKEMEEHKTELAELRVMLAILTDKSVADADMADRFRR